MRERLGEMAATDISRKVSAEATRVGRSQRTATEPQWAALVVRDRSCVFAG